MTDGFYRAFEDKHRGSLEVIKQRQRAYLPLIQPLLKQYPSASAIDLGCGRGEWLELLVETGFQAYGIDLDEGMLAECRLRGLNVRTQDALAALRGIADGSQAVVSGFHFAEHIPFEVLQQVVQEALRVLLPGGLLILETPNPENILVGTSNFYLDPTHERPLPPLLMEFLPEYYGFHRTKILRLQEPSGVDLERDHKIYDVFAGVSPDYAVVAQKAAAPELLMMVSHAFDQDFGVTLGHASARYDAQVNDDMAEIKLQLTEALNVIDAAHTRALHDLDQRYDKRVRLGEAHQQRIQDHLTLIEARRPIPRVKRLIKKIIFAVLRRAQSFINSQPKLHGFLIKVSERLGIFDLLHNILNLGNRSGKTQPGAGDVNVEDEELLADQPQTVRHMFSELDAAIKETEKH